MTNDDIISFNKANDIIVHSKQMGSLLVQAGIKQEKIHILGCFDYLTKSKNKEKRVKSTTIAFCGNLDKSKQLLNKISKLKGGIHFNLYGGQNIEFKGCTTYKGAFLPDNIQHIEGSWGVVWDGDSLDGCKGLLGKYLRINAPHKFSLYLAAELPLIVWDKSALSDIVKEKHIGICIDSLDNLQTIINNISDEEYSHIKSNVQVFSNDIKNGKNLQSIVSDILNKIKNAHN